MDFTAVHVVASTRADHGGTSRSVPALCEALDDQGVDVHLVTSAPADVSGEERPIFPSGEVQTHLIRKENGVSQALRSPCAFYRRLWSVVEAEKPDVIHDHGAWLPSNVVAAWVARRGRIPLVLTPRGMVTEWALRHSAKKKWAAWHLYQKRVFRQSSLFHATAPSEVTDLRALGLTQPVAVIPNGVRLPAAIPETRAKSERRALFLSRLHPKKGLPMLLDAWAQVGPTGWTLELVGPSEDGHREELERQAADLDIQNDVVFSGPVDDSDKWDKYATADLFVLPSHSENFGIVVAEALAAGVPVITTKGTPWRDLETHECGWWVDTEPDAIRTALANATGQTEETLETMGRRGRELVENTYTWPAVGQKMKAAYSWICEPDLSRPSFIQA